MANINIMIGNKITNANLSNKSQEEVEEEKQDKNSMLRKIFNKIFTKKA